MKVFLESVIDKLANITKNDVVEVGVVALFICLFGFVFGMVGAVDYESAVLLEKDYCENLFNDVHKDYKGIEDTCYERYYGQSEMTANSYIKIK